MARAGQVCVNPRRGESVRFVKVAADTNGRLLEMWVEAEPGGGPPPLHSHPRQEERFEIVSGRMGYEINGVAGVACAGERKIVPAGAVHRFWTEGSETLKLRAELVPALRFETFIETIYGLTSAGRVNSKGVPNPLQAAVIFGEFRTEWVPHFLPAPVVKLIFPLLAVLGRLRGYRPWYPEFSPGGPVPARP